MRSLLAILLLGSVAAGIPACDSESQIVTMRIDHYQDPCWDQRPGFCLRVLDPHEDSVHEIAGFEHDWGVVSEVVVMATRASNGTTEYDLIEVLSQEAVAADALFQIQLTPEFVERVDGYTFELVSDKPVVCDTPEVCQAVSQAMFDGLDFEVELGYPDSNSGAFIAYSVVLGD